MNQAFKNKMEEKKASLAQSLNVPIEKLEVTDVISEENKAKAVWSQSFNMDGSKFYECLIIKNP